MDENLINELIEQLEQNLKNVESARKQVEKTVQGYESLKEEVSKYTTDLSFIAQNARTMISQLEEIKEKFLGNISVKIVEEIKAAVRTISSEIDGVTSQTSALHDLADTGFKQVKSNLKQRTDFIDSTLSATRTEIKTVDGKVTSCSDQLGLLSSSLQQLKDNENNHYCALVKRLEEQEASINNKIVTIAKQNKLFSFITILLLLVILGLITYIILK